MNEAILIGLSAAYIVLGWSDVSHEKRRKERKSHERGGEQGMQAMRRSDGDGVGHGPA
jgi:hypothetical protein